MSRVGIAGERLQDHIDAERFGLVADDDAVVFGVLDAEGGGESHGGRFGLGGQASEDAGGPIPTCEAEECRWRGTRGAISRPGPG